MNAKQDDQYKTLLDWHMTHSLRVITYGSGRSYVVVPKGCTLGGHLDLLN